MKVSLVRGQPCGMGNEMLKGKSSAAAHAGALGRIRHRRAQMSPVSGWASHQVSTCDKVVLRTG